MTRNTYNVKSELFNEFLTNPREGIYYNDGRMYVRESPEGDGHQLVAYGNEILAEIEGSDLTFFVGHHGQVSKTVTRHIKSFGSTLSNTEGLTVDVRREAPTNGYVARHLNSAAAQFISNYVDFRNDMSAVENDAVETVEDALKQILEIEFGSDEE